MSSLTGRSFNIDSASNKNVPLPQKGSHKASFPFFLACSMIPVRVKIEAARLYLMGPQPTLRFQPCLYIGSLLTGV